MPGQTKLDRCEILRTAHAAAKHRMAPSHAFRYGDRWNSEARGYVPKSSYREIFRIELRWAWRDAKAIAEDEALEGLQPVVPEAVRQRANDLRTAAWFQPINSIGNRRYRAMLDEASALEAA